MNSEIMNKAKAIQTELEACCEKISALEKEGQRLDKVLNAAESLRDLVGEDKDCPKQTWRILGELLSYAEPEELKLLMSQILRGYMRFETK